MTNMTEMTVLIDYHYARTHGTFSENRVISVINVMGV